MGYSGHGRTRQGGALPKRKVRLLAVAAVGPRCYSKQKPTTTAVVALAARHIHTNSRQCVSRRLRVCVCYAGVYFACDTDGSCSRETTVSALALAC